MVADTETWRVSALDAVVLCEEIRDMMNSYVAYRENPTPSDVVITIKVTRIPTRSGD